MRQCFYALRQNKEVEKLEYVTARLTGEEQPLIKSLKADLQEKHELADLSEKTRATQAMLTLFGRRLSRYF